MNTLLNKTNLFIILSVAALAIGTVALFNSMKAKRIAYVRSNELIYKYQGMKESAEIYKLKEQQWRANLDTLQSDYRKVLNQYNLEYTKLSQQERVAREEYMQKQQENLQQYSWAVQKKAKEEEEKMTQAVLSQINSYAVEYGKKNGFDLILGTTLSGNILYANDALDITNEVLEELNNNYHAKPDSTNR